MLKTLGGDRLGAGKKMKVELHNYERSTHDLGYIWRSTMSAGTLVPFMTQVALPGDAFKKLSIKEGGYVNDKDDAGGETYRGISRKYNPTWQGWTMIDSYKKHYTVGSKEFKSKLDNDVQLQKLVWEKYKIGYWDVFELDDFNSQRVAEQLFDTNVNCGQVAAIKMAQRVLGLKETGRWNLDLLNKLIEIKD